MRRSTFPAHYFMTGHTRFETPDPSFPDVIVCLDCPGATPTTCQHPLTSVSICGQPVAPNTPFCPLHQPLTHLLPRG